MFFVCLGGLVLCGVFCVEFVLGEVEVEVFVVYVWCFFVLD